MHETLDGFLRPRPNHLGRPRESNASASTNRPQRAHDLSATTDGCWQWGRGAGPDDHTLHPSSGFERWDADPTRPEHERLPGSSRRFEWDRSVGRTVAGGTRAAPA